jgi:hypothetical protein
MPALRSAPGSRHTADESALPIRSLARSSQRSARGRRSGEIVGRQFDGLAVRRAAGGAVPGVAIARHVAPLATPFSATKRSRVASQWR